MTDFPRTIVGGVSLPRLIIGSNWFLGYSHTSLAKDNFIKEFQTRERICAIIETFLEHGIDAILAPPNQKLEDAILQAEDKTGKAIIRMWTPIFNVDPQGDPMVTAEAAIRQCKELNGTFCLPHQAVIDALIDRRSQTIRDLELYTRLIRDYGMIPGLSTHMPEAIVYADRMEADIATYIQIYNAAGFLMQVEADWVMRIIREAKHPVLTIKPLAAGKLLPPVGFSFVWNTIRDQDMVCIGTTTCDEARECIYISSDFIERRIPKNELQRTRSKSSLG